MLSIFNRKRRTTQDEPRTRLEDLHTMHTELLLAHLNALDLDGRKKYWNEAKKLKERWRGVPLIDWTIFEANFIVNGEIV